jgi:hypothetical protein
MIRRHTATRAILALALAAAAVAACGENVSTSQAGSPPAGSTATAAVSRASASASGSIVPSPSITASPTENISANLPHLDAKLEDTMPGTVGGTPLEKLSMPLSTYMASETCTQTTPCSDKALYTPWLVAFGKTPDDATLAVATDLTGSINFMIHAFKVPGVDGSRLSAGFVSEARKAGWPVKSLTVGSKPVLQLMDTAREALGLIATGYVYAKGDVMYIVITDDPSLLVQGLILLP